MFPILEERTLACNNPSFYSKPLPEIIKAYKIAVIDQVNNGRYLPMYGCIKGTTSVGIGESWPGDGGKCVFLSIWEAIRYRGIVLKSAPRLMSWVPILVVRAKGFIGCVIDKCGIRTAIYNEIIVDGEACGSGGVMYGGYITDVRGEGCKVILEFDGGVWCASVIDAAGPIAGSGVTMLEAIQGLTRYLGLAAEVKLAGGDGVRVGEWDELVKRYGVWVYSRGELKRAGSIVDTMA